MTSFSSLYERLPESIKASIRPTSLKLFSKSLFRDLLFILKLSITFVSVDLIKYDSFLTYLSLDLFTIGFPEPVTSFTVKPLSIEKVLPV